MSWIESHQALEKHPKVYDLMNLMEWDLDRTIGKLHRFWWWCVDYAEDGDLRKHNESRLAIAVGLKPEDGEKFIDSMMKSYWIDKKPYLRVHDWWHYLGRFLQVKYKHNPNKWKRIQKLYNKRSKGGSNISSDNHIPNQPTLTNQDNQPNISVQIEDLLKRFISPIQANIKIYWERVSKQNKTGIVTDGRKLTLITELYNTKERCADDSLFSYALEQAIVRDAPNIGYINAIIKNRKTKRPL